jgi:transcriptional regulator with XRE-family HTH domain
MIGDYIKSARKRKGFTLRELSEITGISYSFINQIENQTATPSRSSVVALANGLGIPPDDLLQKAGFLPYQVQDHKVHISLGVFGERLKDCMAEQNLSAKELAALCRLDASRIESWVTGEFETSPSLIDIYKMAPILGVTPDFLYGYTDKPEEFSVYMPRPKDLRDILDNEDLMFDQIPFDKKDKEKLKQIIYAVFDD